LNLDIDGWLRRVGLAQYAEIFRVNDIDGELLRRLTNEDLKDIGVASFGHRKKLLEAIARLAGAGARIAVTTGGGQDLRARLVGDDLTPTSRSSASTKP